MSNFEHLDLALLNAQHGRDIWWVTRVQFLVPIDARRLTVVRFAHTAQLFINPAQAYHGADG